MVRSTAIAAAKQAYRLFVTRGLVAPGFTIHVWGFCIDLPEWEICLTNEGKLDSVIRKAK